MIKRIFDLFVSISALIFLFPIIIIIALLILKKLGSPVVFRQTRPGRNGMPFQMIKFRTMTDEVDANGELLSDEHRLTKFGKFLRATSMDELPELWNVIKGDMSLVGPRPLLMDYLPLYNQEQARRHNVLPGLTGWAQINGRNELSWEKKFKYDIWYVDNHSFWLDIKIILLTIAKVFKREGIHSEGQVTAQRFEGMVSGE